MSLFDGSTMQHLEPVCVPRGTYPVRCTRGLAKRLQHDFVREGESHHAKGGPFMWVVVAHCIENNIPFRVDLDRWSVKEMIA